MFYLACGALTDEAMVLLYGLGPKHRMLVELTLKPRLIDLLVYVVIKRGKQMQ